MPKMDIVIVNWNSGSQLRQLPCLDRRDGTAGFVGASGCGRQRVLRRFACGIGPGKAAAVDSP